MRLTLLLALAFNDFKALNWATWQLAKGKPKRPGVDPYTGQWVGMTASLGRLSIGTVFELVEAIRKNNRALQHDSFRQGAAKLKPDQATAWKNVVDVALGKGRQRRLKNYLESVRNSQAFHYGDNGPSLLSAYERTFSRDADGKEAAYISMGNSMEATRFYFADAAAVEYSAQLQSEHGITQADLESFLRDLNKAIRFLVEHAVRHFEANIRPRSP